MTILEGGGGVAWGPAGVGVGVRAATVRLPSDGTRPDFHATKPAPPATAAPAETLTTSRRVKPCFVGAGLGCGGGWMLAADPGSALAFERPNGRRVFIDGSTWTLCAPLVQPQRMSRMKTSMRRMRHSPFQADVPHRAISPRTNAIVHEGAHSGYGVDALLQTPDETSISTGRRPSGPRRHLPSRHRRGTSASASCRSRATFPRASPRWRRTSRTPRPARRGPE